jgi:curved DNA-binding protein CbpA
MRDLYAILEVAPTASPAQITGAYRRLLRRFHPDTRSDVGSDADADAALREVVNAYAVLRDPARRAQYDAERGRDRTPAQPVRVRVVSPVPPSKRAKANSPIRVGPVRCEPPAT